MCWPCSGETDRAGGDDIVQKSEAAEHLGAEGAEAFAADLVAGEAVLLNERDGPSGARQEDRSGAARWPAADNDRAGHPAIVWKRA